MDNVTITDSDGNILPSNYFEEENKKMREYFSSLSYEERFRFECMAKSEHPYIKWQEDLFNEAARFAWQYKDKK